MRGFFPDAYGTVCLTPGSARGPDHSRRRKRPSLHLASKLEGFRGIADTAYGRILSGNPNPWDIITAHDGRNEQELRTLKSFSSAVTKLLWMEWGSQWQI